MTDRTAPLRIDPDNPPLRGDLVVMHIENAGHLRKTLYNPPTPRLRLSPLLDAAVLILVAILVLGLVAGLAGAP